MALAVEPQERALAVVLGLVHGEVGIFAQVGEIHGVLGIERHAHGCAHLEHRGVGCLEHARVERAHERVEQAVRPIGVSAAVDEHEELVARDAREEALALERALDDAGRGLDVVVAPIVAVRVVDVLQIVQVEHEHGAERRRDAGQALRDGLLESTAVQEAREHVVVALVPPNEA